MQIEKQSATLNQHEYQEALRLLDEELAAVSLTRKQLFAYRFLNIAVYGCFSFFLIALLAAVLSVVVHRYFMVEWKYVEVVGVLAIMLSSFFGLMAPLAILFNISLITKIWSRGRRWRDLHSDSPYATEVISRASGSRFGKIMSIVASMLGAGLITVGIAALFTPNPVDTDGIRMLLMGSVLIAVGISIFASYFVRRGRRKLKLAAELARLESSLKTMGGADDAADDTVKISTDMRQKLQGVERQQISRGRQQAILESSQTNDEEATYFVKKSRVVRDTLEELSPETQLLLDDAIFGLSTDPRPDDSRQTESGEIVWKPAGSPLRLKYLIDNDARNIQLLDLKE